MPKKCFNDLRKYITIILNKYGGDPCITEKIYHIINEISSYQLNLEAKNADLLHVQKNQEEKDNLKYFEVYDCAPISYFILSQDFIIKDVNQSGCTLLGFTKRTLRNQCFLNYIAPEFQSVFSNHCQSNLPNQPLISFELKLLRWRESSFHAHIKSKIIKNKITHTQQILLLIADISEKKSEEDTRHLNRIKIAEVERLCALNEMVCTISEDQNHAIAILTNYLNGAVRYLEKEVFQPAALLKILKKAVAQSNTLSENILQRKIISSKSVFHFEYSDLNQVIQQTISLLSYETLEFPIYIQYLDNKNLPPIKLDIFHIQHTILNIARNAIEAMRDHNTVDPKLIIEINTLKSSMVEIIIFDNGPGLTLEMMNNVFDNYYTTKSYAVGLGLKVSRFIIEKHGGELFFLQNPVGGACVAFTLPHAV